MGSLGKFKEYLRFDELGNLYWVKVKSVKVKVGQIAGSLNKKTGYHQVRIEGKLYYSHRVIYSLLHDVELTRSDILDHINGDRSDNRPENIRAGGYRLNNTNLKIHREGKLPNIEYNKCGTFRARLFHSNVVVPLGTFKTEQEAADAIFNYKQEHNLWG